MIPLCYPVQTKTHPIGGYRGTACFMVAAALIFAAALRGNAEEVTVPAGRFEVGSTAGEADERPARTVTFKRYAIERYEVTNTAYEKCVRTGACTPPHYDDRKCLLWTSRGFVGVRVPQRLRRPSFPVTCVTWFQARSYCRSIGKRLPRESEWERAAAADSKRTYAWGNGRPDSSRCATPKDRGPVEVASFDPNPWGLYDMSGNVWEWTADFYQPDYYAEAGGTVRGPVVGYYRVIRGGGWYSGAAQLRIRNRFWFAPSYSEASLGFRCAR